MGNLKKRDHIEEMGVDVDIILKMTFNKSYRMAWIWYMWIRIGASVVNRVTNQGFHNIPGISRVTEELSAS